MHYNIMLLLLVYLPTARWPYYYLSITHRSLLFMLKPTRCALVGAMERAIECAMNVSKGIQLLPARIKDWLNSYCLVTFFCALLLVFVHVTLTISLFRITAICLSANSVVENYESKRLLMLLTIVTQ